MEKRQAPRIETELQVEIEHGAFVGVSKDLSRGGMFLRTTRKFSRGAHLHLQIELPEGQANAEVEVRWYRSEEETEEIGFGVKFLHLSEEMAAYLDSTNVPQGKVPVAREGE
jgi:uncharacterized protein (TIGR02266 family)